MVHFAGHSHYDAATPARSGWRLADGVLTAAELAQAAAAARSSSSRTRARRRRAPPWEGGYGYEGHAFGIGSAFLLAGVRNYVGTFWVVHDDESVLFATACYRALAAGGAPRRGAARGAARGASRRRGSAGLTWASYLLYGDPAVRPSARRPGRVGSRRDAPAAGRGRGSIASLSQVSLARAARGRAGGRRVRDARDAVVGRDAELGRLRRRFDRGAPASSAASSSSAARPGIGKTTLVDAFLAARAERGDALRRARSVGRAVRRRRGLPPGARGAGRVWRATPRHASCVDQLRRHAPTWLAQLPALVEPGRARARCARRTHGATRERMLREMAELLEAVTAERPLVLVLEDLHWSDHSTIELIAYVAQRRAPARLLLIGTYRPGEVTRRRAPAARDHAGAAGAPAAARRSVLEPLGEHDVERYLRVPASASSGSSADLVARDPPAHRGPPALPRQRRRLRAARGADRRRSDGALDAARRRASRARGEPSRDGLRR